MKKYSEHTTAEGTEEEKQNKKKNPINIILPNHRILFFGSEWKRINLFPPIVLCTSV